MMTFTRTGANDDATTMSRERGCQRGEMHTVLRARYTRYERRAHTQRYIVVNATLLIVKKVLPVYDMRAYGA